MVRTLAGDFDAVSDPHSLTVGESFAHVLAKAFVAKVLEVRHVDKYKEQDILDAVRRASNSFILVAKPQRPVLPLGCDSGQCIRMNW